MLRGIWKQLTVLTLCICLFCMGTVACLAEDMTEEPAVEDQPVFYGLGKGTGI